MAHYNSLNVKLSNSQVNKLKAAIKNKAEVVLRLSSNIRNSDDETNFPNKLLLTNRQVANLCKVFANNASTDTKLSKTKLSKTIQSGFLDRLLGTLLKTGLPLMINAIKPLVKSILVLLGLTTAASAADAGMHKKILGSGTATLIISNDEMEGIIKIVKCFEDSGLLLKGVSEMIQNEAKEQKVGFLSMLFGTLVASLLGNILAGKGMNRAGEGFIRAGY